LTVLSAWLGGVEQINVPCSWNVGVIYRKRVGSA